MSSDFEDTCRAIADDLQYTVDGLDPAMIPAERLHLLEPWDPEQLQPDGKRHLAIWPIGEAEAAEDAYMGHAAVELVQAYVILIWEGAGTEGTRRVRDEVAASAFLELHNATRQRLMQSRQAFAGAYLTRYAGTAFPETTAQTRWCRIQFTSRRAEPLI
jgi:hypothetical protein